MRYALTVLLTFCIAAPLLCQEKSDGPSDEKAQKTYQEALKYANQRMIEAALDSFKKADKQDGGHCATCQRKMIKYGMELGDWKAAETAAGELVAEAQPGKDAAIAYYQFGVILMNEALNKKKNDVYSRAHDELSKALVAAPNFPNALFLDGRALAHLGQDDAAKSQFQKFVMLAPADDPDRQRALRYLDEPELARARMAPAFAVTTLTGQRVTLDDLKGKVVLLDFWATWCEPCREALPHMRAIAKKFEGEPLVIMSVSLDSDQQKWKDYVVSNGMTWTNYCDGGFTGPISRLFGVEAIPHTFTIDPDGILQDEHIGDASVEGKLKKLIARARELQVAQKK
ncbi:MAG TPA: redoxin domain-containing protein [Candidatus Acidoferrales bacterium]|nr:redoxin domain-containing protein [Candidatus Acidoferrales bacterium]